MSKETEVKLFAVKFNATVAGSDFSYKNGEVGELTEADAERAIKEGFATKA
jgi:hypothetical protein